MYGQEHGHGNASSHLFSWNSISPNPQYHMSWFKSKLQVSQHGTEVGNSQRCRWGLSAMWERPLVVIQWPWMWWGQWLSWKNEQVTVGHGPQANKQFDARCGASRWCWRMDSTHPGFREDPVRILVWWHFTSSLRASPCVNVESSVECNLGPEVWAKQATECIVTSVSHAKLKMLHVSKLGVLLV